MNRETIADNWLSLQFEKSSIEALSPSLDKALIESFLQHEEECSETIRDQWGNWDIHFSRHDLRKPVLDIAVNNAMLRAGVSRKKIWPGNAPLAVLITHDVDLVSEADPLTLQRKFLKKKNTEPGKLNKLINNTFLLRHSLSSFKNIPLIRYGDMSDGWTKPSIIL